MFKFVLKYLIIFIISVIFVYQFQDTLTKLKLIPKGVTKLIFLEKKIKPTIENKNIKDQIEIINKGCNKICNQLQKYKLQC